MLCSHDDDELERLPGISYAANFSAPQVQEGHHPCHHQSAIPVAPPVYIPSPPAYYAGPASPGAPPIDHDHDHDHSESISKI